MLLEILVKYIVLRKSIYIEIIKSTKIKKHVFGIDEK